MRRASCSALALVTSLAAGIVAAPAAGEEIRLHLVWTNDVHGHVAPEKATFMNPNFPPPLGGGASAAAYVERLRGQIAGDPSQAIVLVDAGDTWSGAPVGSITQGKVMEEYFRSLGYDAVVPGNHEFDKGEEIPIRMAAGMGQKFVCANLFKEGTEDLVDWVEPYRVVNRAGLRVGVVGVITPGTKYMAFEANIAGLEFHPMLPALERWRDHLYDAEKVDVVIAVVHEGLPYDAQAEWKALQDRVAAGEDIRANIRGAMDLAHVLDRVPVIVGGHTHRGYRQPWIDPVTQAMVLESFGNGSSLGHVILKVDPATKSITGWETPRRDGVLVTLFEDEWWPDEATAEDLRPFIETAERGLNVKVGSSRVELSRRGGANSSMGNLITQAMLEYSNADFAFVNQGGLRTDLPAGDITIGDLLKVMPFDNAVVVVQMPGRMIRDIIERKSRRGSSGIVQSGAQVLVDPDAPDGERVKELLVAGRPIEPETIYRVVTTDYLMQGNSGLTMLAQIPPDQVDYTMVADRAVVQRYLEQHSPVAPRSDDRWRVRKGIPQAAYLRNWSLP